MESIKEVKDYVNEEGEHIFILQCECGNVVEIKGCRTCEYVDRNYINYEEAKECHTCSFLHRNYKRKK